MNEKTDLVFIRHVLESIDAIAKFSKGMNKEELISNRLKQSAIVRKNERKVLRFPNSHLTFELLTPDLSKQIEMIRIRIGPGASTCIIPLSHKGEECTFVLDGKMEIQIGDEFFILEEGDTIYYIANIPHKITNIGEKDLIVISSITPSNF